MSSRREFMSAGAALWSVALVGCGADDVDSAGVDGDVGSGGAASGGAASGGSASGGAASGGAASGGAASGGTSSGGTPSSGGSGAGGECASVSADIETFHAHELIVPVADVLAGVAKDYTMTGDHTHAVSVSAEDFAALRAGEQVRLTAGPGGLGDHEHELTLSCEA